MSARKVIPIFPEFQEEADKAEDASNPLRKSILHITNYTGREVREVIVFTTSTWDDGSANLNFITKLREYGYVISEELEINGGKEYQFKLERTRVRSGLENPVLIANRTRNSLEKIGISYVPINMSETKQSSNPNYKYP